jgi:2-polyprenyl-6-methoxyphenol hydroxylase-like FAD-dependent oxidoreductase
VHLVVSDVARQRRSAGRAPPSPPEYHDNSASTTVNDVSVPSREFEAIVVGAGVAGSTAARLLAEWGHAVLLVDPFNEAPPSLAVSIPPSASRVIAATGLAAAVESAGFHPWRGNTVWWGAEEPRIEPFGGGLEGRQVVLSTFTALLRRLTASRGSKDPRIQVSEDPRIQRVKTGVTTCAGLVRDVRLPAASASGTGATSASVSVEREGRGVAFTAQFVLDCSGRAGVMARSGLREIEESHRTVAIAAAWHAPTGWGLQDDTHTLVAAYADGWGWSIPTAPGVRYFTVMIDPRRTDLARGSSAAIYHAELAKVAPFQPLIARGALMAGPWGHDASLYGAREYAGPGFLLVGDAASFIDPLSSFGVKKGLASAWVAAVAAHTALTEPSLADPALAFHDRRERTVYASYCRQSARFAGEATRDGPHPFWTSRACVADDWVSDDIDASTLARDPGVLAAFEDLRGRSSILLRRAADVSTVLRPVIRGNRMALEEHLAIGGCGDGIRFLRNVDLLELIDLAPRCDDVGELFEMYVRRSPSVTLPDFLGAVSFLISQHVLVHDTAPGL